MRLEARWSQPGCRKFRLFLFVILILIGFISPEGFAQSRTTSALAGKVTNENDAALAEAKVEITSPALIGGSRTRTTDANGRFHFLELPPGNYGITVTLTGYKPVHKTGVPVSVGITAEITIEMILYASDETVTVQSESIGIDRTASSVPTIFPPEYLKNIPND